MSRYRRHPATPCAGVLAAAAIAAAIVLPGAAVAAPAPGATPDPSFGSRGFVNMERVPVPVAGLVTSEFSSMRLLSDGTTQLSARTCGVECWGRVLVRLAPSGRVRAVVRQQAAGSGYDVPGLGVPGIVDLPDGGSLLTTSSIYYALAVVGPDGALLRQVGLPLRFGPVAIAPDGSVVGYARRTPEGEEPPGAPPELLRLTPDLGLDGAFGQGGLAGIPPALARVGPVAVTSDAIRVAGVDENSLLLARYTAAGALVRVGRVVATDIRTPRDMSATQLVVRNGRALVVGTVPRLIGSTFSRQAVVVAFRPDGRADRGFAGRGVLRVAEDNARIVLQRDGRIVVASATSPATGAGGRIVLRRFAADARPDPTFPTVRIRTRARLGGTIGLTIDSRSRITVASQTWTPPMSGGVLVARFLTGASRRG